MNKNLIKIIIKKKLFFVAKTIDQDEWILLKNGTKSPLFLDTSRFISDPDLIKKINNLAIKIIKDKKINFNKIMGVPYGGLPFCYGIANSLHKPCIAIRKEGPKKYGITAEILGDYNKGDKILLIEDATVTADTVVSFIKKLNNYGLHVVDVITVVDVGQGGSQNLNNHGVNLHSLFTWSELYSYYIKANPKKADSKIDIICQKILEKSKL